MLEAAIALLGQRPDASVEGIASTAGVSRQTVYAHYPSRDALLVAVNDRLMTESAAALAPITVETGTALDTLHKWLEAAWDLIVRYPILLSPAIAILPPCEAVPLTSRLTELIRYGQRTGELDPSQPESWLVAASISLAYAASREVASGRMTGPEAGEAFRDGVLSLCTRSDLELRKPLQRLTSTNEPP